MMELTNMKMSPEAKKEYDRPTIASGEAPVYPYGLCLHLNDDDMKKLKLSAEGTKVGESFMLHAKVEVKSVSQNKNEQSAYSTMELQITDMALEKGEQKKEQPAAEGIMYDKGTKVAPTVE